MERERSELAAFNPDYARKEKFFRMCAGCSSAPLRYRDGVVEIEIRLSERTLSDETKRENVIRQLAAKWEGVVPGARMLKAHIYWTGRTEPGFNIPTTEIFDKSAKPKDEVVRNLRQQLESLRDANRVDIKLGERIW